MAGDSVDLDAMKRELEEWRRTHPNATFAEMERAVEEQVARLRTALLQEVAQERGEVMTLCPQCGRRMWRRGEYTRELEIPGGLPLSLSRDDHVCPGCSLGLFPPGPEA
jgi:predicted RNA-binding Zn-ribbon protein involved in translation (DUF1610 family)